MMSVPYCKLRQTLIPKICTVYWDHGGRDHMVVAYTLTNYKL